MKSNARRVVLLLIFGVAALAFPARFDVFAQELKDFRPDRCPFTRTDEATSALKDQLTQFSFHVLEQGSPSKNALCESYMNTLNAARTSYQNILKAQKLSPDSSTPAQSDTQSSLDAQIQMSNALQGMLNSSCIVDDEGAISSTVLNVINSIANTITIAGLVHPGALLIGVGLSAVSQLGAALANALMSHDSPRDRLKNALKNDEFLERLCIFRELAYRLDALDPTSIDIPAQKRKSETELDNVERQLYDGGSFQCFLQKDLAQERYEKLSSDLKEILAANEKISASQKCTQYIYALQDKAKHSDYARGMELFDLVWRIGCDDIGFIDVPTDGNEASPAALPEEIAQPADASLFQSRRVGDYCKQWRNLLDKGKAVDCFGADTQAIDSFNATAEYIFNNAASVGEASIVDASDDNPDLYAAYRKLKSQRDLLKNQLKFLDESQLNKSNSVVQIQGMLTNLGDIILGKELPGYADWHKKEIQRNIENATEKLDNAKNGTPTQQCEAARFATQRLRHITPRLDTMRKICSVLGAHSSPPRPAFKDPTRTFSSIVDLPDSPLDGVCTLEYLYAPKNYEPVSQRTSDYLENCKN